ncbi:hypothetical protein [Nitrosophilus kaiyonis]|uniref:hypothetical protein n=1 Tax=Nitrosophilus kaiyonis TaxID=2930200 RepID=UPI002490DCD6|nr:hypothetical protein [Nitrosophilus kaiyonis]
MKKFIIYLLIGLGVPLFAAFPATTLNINKNINKNTAKHTAIKSSIKVIKYSAKQNTSTGKIDWSITLKCINLQKRNLTFNINVEQYDKKNRLVCTSYIQNITKSFTPKKNICTFTITGQADRCCISKKVKLKISPAMGTLLKKSNFTKIISLKTPAVNIRNVTFDKTHHHWKATVKNNTSHRISATLQGYQYVNNRWRAAGGQVLNIEPLSSKYLPFWVTMDYDPNATKLKLELSCNGELLETVTKNIPK